MKWISPVKFINKNDQAADANQAAQTAFYNTLTANYNSDYSQFEGATESLQSTLQPIISAGPGQYGYDPTEDAAIRGSALNADAASAQNAQVATQEQITAQNDGASLTPTGAMDELRQQGDVAAAQKTATDQNAITQAGYAAGNTNYTNALSGEENVLGLMNPSNFAGAATSGGNAATGSVNAATNAAEASDSWMTMVGGALGGVTGALTANALKPSPPKP